MSILTETIVDILDRHTAVEQFRAKPVASAAVSLTTQKGVLDLHDRLRDKGRIDLGGAAATTSIRRLSPGYANHKYWHRVLATRLADGYAAMAWEQLLPILAEPAFRISFMPTGVQTWRASPVARALVYPFGWSGWLSLRITGNHSLQNLAGLVKSLFEARPLRIDNPSGQVGIRGLFDAISEAVRSDLFSNRALADRDTQDIMVVTTVLAKHGGSPSIAALSAADRDSILTLVRPGGPVLTSLTGHVYQPDNGRPLEYIVFDDNGWFIWNERLLAPEDRNREHLRCYHNNTVRSLVHARQLEGVLRVGLATPKRPKVLSQILEVATQQLAEPQYRNASLRTFTDSGPVQKLLKKARPGQP